MGDFQPGVRSPVAMEPHTVVNTTTPISKYWSIHQMLPNMQNCHLAVKSVDQGTEVKYSARNAHFCGPQGDLSWKSPKMVTPLMILLCYWHDLHSYVLSTVWHVEASCSLINPFMYYAFDFVY